jgi:hypothetical protein
MLIQNTIARVINYNKGYYFFYNLNSTTVGATIKNFYAEEPAALPAGI